MRTLTQGYKYNHKNIWGKKELTTDEKMGRAINRLRFKSGIWEKGPNVGFIAIWQMVNDVRYLSGLEKYTYDMVWDGYQYCNIFADNYKHALAEFRHLCWGDW